MDNVDFQQHSALVNQITNTTEIQKELAANALSKVTKEVQGITDGLGSPLMMVGLQKVGEIGLDMYSGKGSAAFNNIGKALGGDYAPAYHKQFALKQAQQVVDQNKQATSGENTTVSEADDDFDEAGGQLTDVSNTTAVSGVDQTALAAAKTTVEAGLDDATTAALAEGAAATSELIGTGIGAIVPLALGLGAILGGAFGVSSSPSSVPSVPNVSDATNV